GLMANPDISAVQRKRHGRRRLARRPALRPFWILCARVRGRHRRKHSQPGHCQRAGRAEAPATRVWSGGVERNYAREADERGTAVPGKLMAEWRDQARTKARAT